MGRVLAKIGLFPVWDHSGSVSALKILGFSSSRPFWVSESMVFPFLTSFWTPDGRLEAIQVDLLLEKETRLDGSSGSDEQTERVEADERTERPANGSD